MSYVLREHGISHEKGVDVLLDDLTFAIMVTFPEVYSFQIPLPQLTILSSSDV